MLGLVACLVHSGGIEVSATAKTEKSDPATASNTDVKQTVAMVPMRDGVRLKTIIFQLAGQTGPAPVVLVRTPYNQDQPNFRKTAERFARAGYVSLTQDCRGRFGSEGQFVFYWGEGPDGFDTVEWIRKQPWSNGHVGMWGASYMGSDQWLTAAEGTPLTAMTPTAGATNFYYNLHVGGLYMLPMARMGFSMDLFGPKTDIGNSPKWPEWYQHLPLTDWGKNLNRRLPWQEAMIAHDLPDGFWNRAQRLSRDRTDERAGAVRGRLFRLHVPRHCPQLSGDAAPAPTEFARKNQQLILGPWDHGTGTRKAGDIDFGPAAQVDVAGENLAWFDRFLKQKSNSPPFPQVRYFSMGENRWHEADDWPPPQAVETSFFIHSGGHANSYRGDGRLELVAGTSEEPADNFRSDPADPVPTWPALGKQYREVWGPVDQELLQDRDDILLFKTEPLSQPLVFAEARALSCGWQRTSPMPTGSSSWSTSNRAASRGRWRPACFAAVRAIRSSTVRR